jgi:hypothetical protein
MYDLTKAQILVDKINAQDWAVGDIFDAEGNKLTDNSNSFNPSIVGK